MDPLRGNAQDPWDWSIDQVIEALCDPKAHFRSHGNPEILPDSGVLEHKLREQCVDGSILLTNVDPISLKEDFAISALGQRGVIVREVHRLQRESRKYYEYAKQIHSGSGYAYQLPPFNPLPPVTPNNSTRVPGLTPTSRRWRDQLPSEINGATNDSSIVAETLRLHSLKSGHQESESGLGYIPSQTPLQGKKYQLTGAVDAPLEYLGDGPLSPLLSSGLLKNVVPTADGQDSESGDAYRTRQALTLVSPAYQDPGGLRTPASTAEASPARSIPFPESDLVPAINADGAETSSEASTLQAIALRDPDEDLQPDSGKDQHASEVPHDLLPPSVEMVGVEVNSRKRIAPTLISHPHDNTPLRSTMENDIGLLVPDDSHTENKLAQTLVDGNFLSRKPSQSDLGTKAKPIDTIFYGNTALGQEINLEEETRPLIIGDIDNPKNFTLTSTGHISNGQRRYVSSRVKFFLQQEAQNVQRGLRRGVGIIPYPDRLLQQQFPSSVTVFKVKEEGIAVLREDRGQWTTGDKLVGAFEVYHATTANHVFTTNRQDDTGEDWDFLEKWNHLAGHETVYPTYGNSGSEGEYDLDTWREMEEENGGKIDRVRARSRNTKKLSDPEVHDTLDRAIQLLLDNWSKKRLPRLQRMAYSFWTKSRRYKTKRHQIKSLTEDVKHFDDRLKKIRTEIARERWSSVKKVIAQSESLRETLFNREDSRWKIEILKSNTRPDKPEKGKSRINVRIVEPLVDGEEDLETDLSASDFTDELNDFIVSDDNESPGRQDDDATTTDASDETKAIISSRRGDAFESDANDGHIRPLRKYGTEWKPDQSLAKTMKTEVSSQPQKPSEASNFIDLTLDTDQSEIDTFSPAKKNDNIRTPLVHSDETDEDPFIRSRRKRERFKQPPGVPYPVNVIDLDVEGTSSSPSSPTLPGLHDIDGISKMDPKMLIERADRKRLLIYILSRVTQSRREAAFAYISSVSPDEFESLVWRTLQSIRRPREKEHPIQNNKELSTLKDLTGWFISWTNASIIKKEGGASHEQVRCAASDREGFGPFLNILLDCQCLRFWSQTINKDTTSINMSNMHSSQIEATSSQESLLQSQTTPVKKKRALLELSDDNMNSHGASKFKKRKYAVAESQEGINLRQNAQERMVESKKRGSRLVKSLEKSGHTGGQSDIVINTGKLENQELICVESTIAARIQPHQVDGIRFLWREIIGDEESQQGCLLAQTMGLGKTMQVISFLVTVADAANSPNENIHEQIPPRLQTSQTLILCPPALVHNWLEEFEIWTPNTSFRNIGQVHAITASIVLQERLGIIREWAELGGVLILGYSTFREIVINRSVGKIGKQPLDDEVYKEITGILLQRPNIVVADEAHHIKNRKSKLSQTCARFKSKSRIALTGSPLSNNMGEYYSLIDWVAPGFLGEANEFRAHYEEPIEQGLYRDSTKAELRLGLKRLELFKREVQPKVHRADRSVLEKRLKGKSEFVIKLPLTDLQMGIYTAFIHSVVDKGFTKDNPNQTELWTWLAMLRLVCNHPQCFHDKLYGKGGRGSKSKENRAKAKRTKVTAIEPKTTEVEMLDEDFDADAALLDASLAQLAIPEDVLHRLLEPFKELSVPLDHISLSHKMNILLQILDLAKATGDKVLVFSHSIPTLDYVQQMVTKHGLQLMRMDGSSAPAKRQKMTKIFNNPKSPCSIFLVSTRAGGTGLNLFGANRIVILDDHFNPIYEEQAVGRAYRLGQKKHVFVYRLTVGGTFEEVLHNQSLFKQQLATRAVDRKHLARQADRDAKQYIHLPKDVEQEDLGPMMGKDVHVLDEILTQQAR